MSNTLRNFRKKSEIFGTTNNSGFCAICGNYGKLTADHVPPVGCLKISGAIKDVIFRNFLSEDRDQRRPPIIQGGVKFNTVCTNCNSDLLGRRYDPSLNNFAANMLEALRLRQNPGVSPVFKLSLESHKIARSVIGHILAAHSVEHTKNKLAPIGASESLRKYLLDSTLGFPKEWRLYCWPYLGKNQVIHRHVAMTDFSVNSDDKVLYGHILKFFPLGFWFVHNQPAVYNLYLPEITPSSNCELDTSDDLIFDTRNIPSRFFPENPVGNQAFLLCDDQCSVASPR
ncbi:hypothetical protein [Undibacterium curvum]|uniref:HNH endonuclease n=1 Tax=Undibacterium curvum TaxID=2762294 RepID=A0ABR7A2E6_9BURK|nr:hypothetical protein [Undibacterium curvum]MBC3931067.1 hypothetical protein [Undibacterium curvum]